jgi:hypothetical protein
MEEIQESLNEELITCTEPEETRVFNQWTLIKSIIVRQLDTIKRTFLYLIDGYRFFSEMSEKLLYFKVFCNIVEFILCLPGSTAPVERIFCYEHYVVKGEI